MATKSVQFLSFTATQGAANGFIQATVATGVTPQVGYGLILLGWEWQLAPTSSVSAAATMFNLNVVMTKDTQTAILGETNTNVLSASGLLVFGPAAANVGLGLIQQPVAIDLQKYGQILAVTPNLYVSVDSTGLTSALTVEGRIFYESIKLSELEILRILQA